MRMTRALVALVAIVACQGPSRHVAPIRLEPLITLGAEGGAGIMVTTPQVSAHHPLGYRVLVPQPGGISAAPMVYADDGKYLGELQAGAPPGGDFRQPLFARIGPGDSLWVFDGSGRVLVFGPDRRFAHSDPLPAVPWDAVVLGDGRMVVSSADADGALPLFELDPHGKLVRRIGESDPAALAIHSARRIITGAGATVWTMPVQLRWRLEHWDSAGRLSAAFERQPEWFAWYGRARPTTVNQAPQPHIQGAWLDQAGRLWTLALVADANWATGLGQTPGKGTMIVDPDKVFDTVLEVRDLTSGDLVASTQFDVAYSAVAEPGVVVRIRETRLGWKQAELLRVLLDTAQLHLQAGK